MCLFMLFIFVLSKPMHRFSATIESREWVFGFEDSHNHRD